VSEGGRIVSCATNQGENLTHKQAYDAIYQSDALLDDLTGTAYTIGAWGEEVFMKCVMFAGLFANRAGNYNFKASLKTPNGVNRTYPQMPASKDGISFSEGVSGNFSKHAFAGGRHADLGLSVETMTSKGMGLIKNNVSLLKAGDNTLIGNINGIQKSFKAFVKDGKIMSVNMYPGVSNRATQGTFINFGSVTW
jgi:hypothetical protein